MTRLFASKKKTVVAIVFTALYTLLLLLDVDFRLPFFQNFRYALNSLMIYLMRLITPVLVMVFLFCANKDYPFKKWLFPMAFGLELVRTFLLLSTNFAIMDLVFSNATYGTAFVCTCLMMVALCFMFAGTLWDFKCFSFFKYGTFAYIILALISLSMEFSAENPLLLWQNIPSELLTSYLLSHLLSWAQTITRLLFYIGIFILTMGKKDPASV